MATGRPSGQTVSQEADRQASQRANKNYHRSPYRRHGNFSAQRKTTKAPSGATVQHLSRLGCGRNISSTRTLHREVSAFLRKNPSWSKDFYFETGHGLQAMTYSWVEVSRKLVEAIRIIGEPSKTAHRCSARFPHDSTAALPARVQSQRLG